MKTEVSLEDNYNIRKPKYS